MIVSNNSFFFHSDHLSAVFTFTLTATSFHFFCSETEARMVSVLQNKISTRRCHHGILGKTNQRLLVPNVAVVHWHIAAILKPVSAALSVVVTRG